MTVFIDGLGRTISRDDKIVENLLQRYRDTNMVILAQAGKEIEFLREQLAIAEKKVVTAKTEVKKKTA